MGPACKARSPSPPGAPVPPPVPAFRNPGPRYAPSMAGGRKRRRRDSSEAPAIHLHNRYAAGAPDFAKLASPYPSFRPFVSVSRGRASIDFATTRELTRVLLLHDHGVY